MGWLRSTKYSYSSVRSMATNNNRDPTDPVEGLMHSTIDRCRPRVLTIKAGDRVFCIPVEFLSLHPGGAGCIQKRADRGDDCTVDLQFHSRGAQKLWRRYEVYPVVESDCVTCIIQ